MQIGQQHNQKRAHGSTTAVVGKEVVVEATLLRPLSASSLTSASSNSPMCCLSASGTLAQSMSGSGPSGSGDWSAIAAADETAVAAATE